MVRRGSRVQFPWAAPLDKYIIDNTIQITNDIERTVLEREQKADDIVLNARRTLILTSGEYKGTQPDFEEAMETVDVESLVQSMFTSDCLRYGDVRLPGNIPARMRYLLAKNLAKETAKQLTIYGRHAIPNVGIQAMVYALLTEKLTDRLLSRQE